MAEYPPIIDYDEFHGKILVIERKDVLLAIELQRRLRLIDKPKNFSRQLTCDIAIVCEIMNLIFRAQP